MNWIVHTGTYLYWSCFQHSTTLLYFRIGWKRCKLTFLSFCTLKYTYFVEWKLLVTSQNFKILSKRTCLCCLQETTTFEKKRVRFNRFSYVFIHHYVSAIFFPFLRLSEWQQRPSKTVSEKGVLIKFSFL